MATLASDGSPSDVQAKINAAAEGDTITLPAGSFPWTSGVTVAGKGIHIKGAGGGRVEGKSSSTVSISTGSKSFTIRSGSTITGFTAGEAIIVHDTFRAANTMTGTVTSWNGTTLVVNAIASTGSSQTNFWTFEIPATTTIIHNAGSGVLFDITLNATASVELSDLQQKAGTGTGYGITNGGTGKPLLLHDYRSTAIHQGIRDYALSLIVWRFYADALFDISNGNWNNVDNAIQCADTNVGPSWTNANTCGTNDATGVANIYIEDSYFVGLVGGAVDVGDNARMVIRHCVFDNSAIELHGQETDPIGIRHLEAYNNLFIFNEPSNKAVDYPANLNYWFEWRGGSGLVHDNTFDHITSTDWGTKKDLSLECMSINRLPTIFSPSGWNGSYPAGHQPGQGSNGSANSYSFSGGIYNTVNGSIEGVFFYNNTSVGGCSPTQYSPDDVGLGKVVTDYIQQDRDYFLRAPAGGDAYSGYTTYTYPHPLAGGTPTTTDDPVLSPVAGAYVGTQSVTISTTTAGASIRYTLDGSTPSDTVGAVYSGAITISSTQTVKAIAYKSGLSNSNVVSAAYVINSNVVNFTALTATRIVLG